MLLFLADTFHHVNRFSMFWQSKNLFYSGLSPKLFKFIAKFCTEIENLMTEVSPLFWKHTEEFLNLSHESMNDAS